MPSYSLPETDFLNKIWRWFI